MDGLKEKRNTHKRNQILITGFALVFMGIDMNIDKSALEYSKKMIISLLEERKAKYHPTFARALNDVNAALLLTHLIILTGKQHENCWIERTTEEFLTETGLTKAEQERARRKLRAYNILIEKKIGQGKTIYLKVNLKKVFKTLMEYIK